MNDYVIDMEELNPAADDVLYAEDPRAVARNILAATGAYKFTPDIERDWKRWREPLREDETLKFTDIGHRFSSDDEPLFYRPEFIEDVEAVVFDAYNGNKDAREWLYNARRNLGLRKK